METVAAWCSECQRKTAHEVLYRVGYTPSEDAVDVTCTLLQCRGCETISLAKEIKDLFSGETERVFYPSHVSRKKPAWLEGRAPWLVGLFDEIYQTVEGGQHRVAAMGIRALLEQVMIAKLGDSGTFEHKMELFQEKGYISLIQRDAMRETIELGHAAMHRAFAPNAQELNKALDIVEGIMATIYNHSEVAMTLAKRVPSRRRKPAKK